MAERDNFTVRLSDDEKGIVLEAAAAERRKPADWARLALTDKAAEVLARAKLSRRQAEK